VPLIDTLLAMVRRFLERRPIFAPDRGHIHHRLLAMGLTHRRAVLTLYGLSIAFTTIALVVSIGRNWQIGAALAILSLMVVGVVRAMGNFDLAMRRVRRRERVRPASVERLRGAVPPLLARISAARETPDLAQVLEDFVALAGLVRIELTESRADLVPAFCFTAEPSGASGEGLREVVVAKYPLRGAGEKAVLKFAWTEEDGDVTAEADILLQLVADACEARLRRADAARAAVAKGHLRSL